MYAGADKPLARQPVTGTRAHGENGLEGMEVDAPLVAVEPDGAIRFMNETLRAAGDNEITLVAIGPTDQPSRFSFRKPRSYCRKSVRSSSWAVRQRPAAT